MFASTCASTDTLHMHQFHVMIIRIWIYDFYSSILQPSSIINLIHHHIIIQWSRIIDQPPGAPDFKISSLKCGICSSCELFTSKAWKRVGFWWSPCDGHWQGWLQWCDGPGGVVDVDSNGSSKVEIPESWIYCTLVADRIVLRLVINRGLSGIIMIKGIILLPVVEPENPPEATLQSSSPRGIGLSCFCSSAVSTGEMREQESGHVKRKRILVWLSINVQNRHYTSVAANWYNNDIGQLLSLWLS